ncbi:YraN family protein [Obesumbacterium proteus]|jgi:putative endonuclease|uniref:YraN family protein n=1 Tax=Obesumbacterium proteus TaxID=82983 RepID=UPI001F3FAE31|nr:YraN family protein [Obesumbacterium proteus]MCE9885351.1 YraN family protein [Obesumbacterium proteus]MCE9915418.1 YraN family protein [Obesumbacterium proteus]MCE9930128.1 YraN family protein [Obesumbacterium proteus]MCG2876524.1 YraN family protein [Obesumbacterium proteus]
MAPVPCRKHSADAVSRKKVDRRQIGAQYEMIARQYLERAGLNFYAANVTLRGGELDLIMRDGETWVFVEVRYRRTSLYGDAAASVSYTKQRRLLHSAAIWLAERGGSFDTTDCRFDVLAITGSQLQWLPNAFAAAE